ncbi:MAG TPA: SPFH domain-containing protein [Gemmatimonadaceae bacterium]|nr:SPFH domain-containing protein [Gemmatimonadaceae bacterium]
MTLRDFIQGELIDIVEWLESSTDAMAWRFDRPDNEIKNGAKLIVRPGQLALFVEQGTVADVFQPGSHELATKNLPLLSKLRGWKYGFESPFKAEIVFISTRQFTNLKWGTKTPVMTRDPELGAIRLRAYGTYALRVRDAESFVRELVGANSSFTIGQISDQIRDMVASRFGELLGEKPIPVLQLAANYRELGELAREKLAAELARLGVELTQLVVESIALPDEVAATLDQKTRLGLLGGDLGSYAQLQAADAIRDSARNQGTGGAGAAIGVGLGMAQQLAGAAGQAMSANAANNAKAPASSAAPQTPPPIAPPPLPNALAIWLGVRGTPTGPLDLAALKQHFRDGTLTADTLTWRTGMAEWKPASQMPELKDVLAGG